MSDPEDVCIYSCATSAVYGQARLLGELLRATHSQNIIPPYTPPFLTYTYLILRVVRVDYTYQTLKQLAETGANIHICSQVDVTCPNKALDQHIAKNKPPPHYPLFCFQSQGGYIALTKRRLLKRCNDIWSTYGLCTFTGHCFRIGGTTLLLLRGVDPSIVKAMGRWTSDSFLRYWRSLEVLAPLHAEFLAPYITHVLPPAKFSDA